MQSPSPTTEMPGADDVYREAFGVLLVQQGRGFYVTLELMAILWGTKQMGSQILPPFSKDLKDDRRLTYRQRSHDFARRLMADGSKDLSEEERQFLVGDSTVEILRELLSSLMVPIPNRQKLTTWKGLHFYPYVGELIHYDAVQRGGRNIMERYTYRGGGALIHKILRTDPDQRRLEDNREGLGGLIADAEGPLGQLALACAGHDAIPQRNFPDGIEPETEPRESIWVEHIRKGTRNITTRANTTRAKKVEMLMHWLPYCLARYQLDVAARVVGTRSPELPIALLQYPNPIRGLARKEMVRSRSLVDQALATTLNEMTLNEANQDRRDRFKELQAKKGWKNTATVFFSQTMASCGALNAHVGSYYLTIKMPLLEAIVCSALEPDESVEFEVFCHEVLFEKFRLVIDRKSAASSGLLNEVDATFFSKNSEKLANDLSDLGMLSAYSDATRMIHGEVR